MIRHLVVASALALVSAGPVQAQPQDWDLIRQPNEDRLTAAAAFTDGFLVAIRCARGNFDVLLAGIPEASGHEQERVLEVGLRGGAPEPQSWINGTSREVVFSQLPGHLARELREGGLMQVVIPASRDAPAQRFAVELPPSPSAINETMTACDVPIVDRRNREPSWVVPAGPPAGLSWLRAPRTNFPEQAIAARVSRGVVVLSCLTLPDGRLEDCEVESEFPGDAGFGEQAIRSTRNARVQSPGGGEVPRRIVSFQVRFLMRN